MQNITALSVRHYACRQSCFFCSFLSKFLQTINPYTLNHHSIPCWLWLYTISAHTRYATNCSPLRLSAIAILSPRVVLYAYLLIVWRPSAALLTAVIPIVRRPPYALPTAAGHSPYRLKRAALQDKRINMMQLFMKQKATMLLP